MERREFHAAAGVSSLAASMPSLAPAQPATRAASTGCSTRRTRSLASRREDGDMTALAWNLAEVEQPPGSPGASTNRNVSSAARRLMISVPGRLPEQNLRFRYVNQERGSQSNGARWVHLKYQQWRRSRVIAARLRSLRPTFDGLATIECRAWIFRPKASHWVRFFEEKLK